MKPFFFASVLALVAGPAAATGGMVCQTASGPATTLSFTIGHGEANGVVAVSRLTGGRWAPAHLGQAWISGQEFKADLTDPNRTRRLARIETSRKGVTYDGAIVENGRRRWIRCREG